MKCQKCGENIKKNDKYCGNCGVQVTKPKDNKYYQIMRENKLKIILCAILIVVVGITYYIFNYLSSASYMAMKYFKAITNNDTEEVYNMIDLKETKLLNLKLLKEKIAEYKDIDNIEIIGEDISNNNALITFKYTSDTSSNIAQVSLTKKDNKWTINSGQIAENVTIVLPKGATIILDDIDISEYKDNDQSTDTTDIYNIDNMIKGSYKIKVTLKDGTNIESDVTITSNNTYRLGDIDLSEEIVNTINTKTLDLINNIYNSIINNNENIEYNSNISEYYKDLKYDYDKSNFTLNSFNIKDLKQIKTTDNNGYLSVTYQVEYEYTITYEGVEYSSVNRDYITVLYDYDYNLYKIKNIDLRFSIRK